MKKSALLVCALMALLPAGALAQSKSRQRTTMTVVDVPAETLQEGLVAFYNSDVNTAEIKFNAYIALRPDDPIGYWRKAVNNFARYYDIQKSETPKLTKTEFKAEEALIKKGIACAMRGLGRGQNVPFNRFIIAYLYSLQAAYELGNKSYLDAISSMKKGKAFAESSSYQDAKGVLATMNYRGAEHGFLTSLAGLPRDREFGMALFMEAEIGNTGMFSDDIRFAIFKLRFERERARTAGTLDRSPQGDILDIKYPLDVLAAELFAKYPQNKELIEYWSQK